MVEAALYLSPGLQVSFTGSAMLSLGVGKLKWEQDNSFSLGWRMVLELILVSRWQFDL
jgi:hypothetical protein